MARKHRSGIIALAGAAAIALAACSGGSTPSPSTGGGAGGTTVDVKLAEWSVTSSATSAPAGDVTFKVANNGAQVHELIVAKTDTKADALPVADGKVDEAGLTVVDEVEDVAAGATADLVLTDLAAGHYAIFCNIEGHYGKGMYADFDVR